MAVALAPRGRAGFASAHPKFQWLRGVLLLATSFCSFFARAPHAGARVHGHQHADAAAGDACSPRRCCTSACRGCAGRSSCGGFAGALVVIRPGSGAFGWVVALPLLGAAAYASFQVLTSRLAGAESPMTTHFWTGFVGTVVLWPVLAVAAAAQGWDASLAIAASPAGQRVGADGLRAACSAPPATCS